MNSLAMNTNIKCQNFIRESCEEAKIRIYNSGLCSNSGKGSNNAIVTEHGTQTKNENHLGIIGVTEMKGGEG